MSLLFNILSCFVISFLPKRKVKVLVTQLCLTLCDSMGCSTPICQAPLSMEFSRQEYWSGLSFLSPGDLPDPGIEPESSVLQVDSLPSEPLGKRRRLLISRLQSPSTVILTPKKIKAVTVSTSSPCICHQVMGTLP